MIVLLVGLSIHYGGVRDAPLLFIFVITSMVAVAVTRGISLKERVTIFSRGAGSTNLMLMVWIFMLAGAFAATAKEMGAAGAMVDLTLRILPANFALAGLFIAACLTSICMGTSVGTIVALMPIATGMAEAAVFLLDQPDQGRVTLCVLRRDRPGAIGGAVVYHNNLIVVF